MDEIVKFIDHWQTLIGAIIGGLFALSVALLVAYKARRSEEISAAMLLVGDLVSVRVAGERLDDLAVNKKISKENYALWFSEKMILSRPKISPLFEASVIRVMPINKNLAAHLELFHTIYTAIEHKLERLSKDFEAIREKGKPIRSNESMLADADIVLREFKTATTHAYCAEQLLSRLVLNNFPTWRRLRRIISPSSHEQRCHKLLKEGDT